MFLAVILVSQLFFTVSDLLARTYMPKYGFKLEAFVSVWFMAYLLVRTVATAGQLYIFSTMELGRTMAYFAAASLLLSNLIGFLLFKEVLSPLAYIGVSLAFVSIVLLAHK